MQCRANLIAVAMVVAVAACSGQGGQPVPAAPAPSADVGQLALPRLEQMLARNSAGALGNVRSGSQFFDVQGDFARVKVEGDSALYRPGLAPREYAYAAYLFSSDRPWQSLWLETTWQIPPALAPQTNLWIGLVSYPVNKFVWFARESLGGMFIGDAAEYASCWSDGNYYLPVYVVVTGTEGAILDELRLREAADDLTWELEIADSHPLCCRYMALRLDADDEPRVFYQIEQAGNVYAERNNGVWTPEVIYSGHPAGRNCALVLDAAENPHLAYTLSGEQTDTRLFYATRQAGTWNQETAVSRPELHLGNMVLDSTDNPHLVYYDSSDASLNYAARGAAGWLIDRVIGPCDRPAALSLTPADVPQIAFYANSLLRYAFFQGPTWGFTVVDREPGNSRSLALMHDSYGRINLAYFSLQAEPPQLMHAFWHGETSVFTPAAEIKGHVSNSLVVMRLDSQQSPHIAYSEYVLGQFGVSALRYARITGDEWQVETVYDGLNYEESFAFDLDSHDRPHFCFCAYFEIGEQPVSLYYARPR